MKNEKKHVPPLRIAVISFSLFLFGVILYLTIEVKICIFFFIMSFTLSISALVCGIIGIIKGAANKKHRFGKFSNNLLAVILALLILYAFFLGLERARERPSKAVCYTNLTGLGKAISWYNRENDGYFPDFNQWCDLLILHADVGTKSFICPYSNAIEGESSYAMNINLRGKRIDQIEPNVVVLFETDYGFSEKRYFPAKKRIFYQKISERWKESLLKDPNSKVYKDRWNQSGGPELLSAENHKGEGANILFNNGSIQFIAKEDFNDLNWGKEPKDPNTNE